MDLKRKYAHFLLEGCLRLKKDDKLFIIADDIIMDFVNLLKEEASIMHLQVETLISHHELIKELYLTKEEPEILNSPLIDKSRYNQMAREGYAFLMLSSPIPGYYDDIPTDLLNKVDQQQLNSIKEYKEYQLKNLIKWNISAVPNEIWAKSLPEVKTLSKLWDLIFKICLINEDNPTLAWQEKMTKLKNRATYLNNLHIKKLIYHNSLGTNLEIGLPTNYLFSSADGINIVNMPTEEVFTSPNKYEVNGKVYSSKILLYNNHVISNFYLEFKNGRIINYDAESGKEILKDIINTDEGSHYLGEVALVDYSSPISLTNVIFKNTLYDENASCHLAIGEAFPECLKDGLSMSKEELISSSLNFSSNHVDFFIGTPDLEIKALLQNNKEVVIMEKGNFKEE